MRHELIERLAPTSAKALSYVPLAFGLVAVHRHGCVARARSDGLQRQNGREKRFWCGPISGQQRVVGHGRRG